jgi:hypothetical protein
MKCPSFTGAGFLAAVSLLAVSAAQTKPQLLASTEIQVSVVRSVQVVAEHDGPALEIVSTHPLVPSIRTLENPRRLVIDLPNANLSSSRRLVDFHSQEIGGIRVNQFQKDPPIGRIVIDLSRPVGYTWDAAGNRLMIRLRSTDQAAARLPSVPAFTPGVQPAVVPLASSSGGAVLLAGSGIAAGSSVTAGSDTAILRLGRGGEVRVCPGTTVSVTASQNGRALMLGMSTGALEAHYRLEASADSILTPDFRIQLPGPGEFHYAVSADSKGNTCVRALPGNTASVIISELLGDGTYQVKPSEQAVFHSGRLTLVDAAVPPACGCPPPQPQVMRAAALLAPEPVQAAALRVPLSKQTTPGTSAASSETSGFNQGLAGPETAPLPPSRPNDIHVEVEAPFVFRAGDPPPASSAVPAPVQQAELLKLRGMPETPGLQTPALPPTKADARPEHHGFFGRIRGFFSSIFG